MGCKGKSLDRNLLVCYNEQGVKVMTLTAFLYENGKAAKRSGFCG